MPNVFPDVVYHTPRMALVPLLSKVDEFTKHMWTILNVHFWNVTCYIFGVRIGNMYDLGFGESTHKSFL